MKEIKKREMGLLEKLCLENNLDIKLMKQLKNVAEINAYENKSSTARRKEYTDLIDFYIKKGKGE